MRLKKNLNLSTGGYKNEPKLFYAFSDHYHNNSFRINQILQNYKCVIRFLFSSYC